MTTLQAQKPARQQPAAKLPRGYYSRPPTMDDLEATLAMFQAESVHMVGIEMFELNDIESEWTTPGFDLARDTRLVLAPDGDVAGYYEVWDLHDPHVLVNAWGRVHPEHTGKGIGSYLVRWAERRARQAIPLAPPAARVVLYLHALSKNKAAGQLFLDHDFEFIRHSLRMRIDLDGAPPEPRWPEGITVRTMLVGEDERGIVNADREAFQDHWGYVERPFEEEYERWIHMMRTDENFDPNLWFLAMDGDEIAGFALCAPKAHHDPEMGWVRALGVRRPWRRRGIALALLYHCFNAFYARGVRKVGLGVDAESLTGATRLYEKAGMRPEEEFQYSLYEKELRPGEDLTTREAAG